MNAETQRKPFSLTSKKVVVVSLVTFTLLMLAITAQLSYVMLVYDKIYKGVYINSVHVGGMTRTELEDTLKKQYQDKLESANITLKAGDTTYPFNFKDIHVIYGIDSIADKAYFVGRSGNLFERLAEISKVSKENLKLDMPVSYDKEKLEAVINQYYEKTFVKPQDAELVVDSNKATLRSGHKGKSIDKAKALAESEKAIIAGDSKTIELPLINTPPAAMNVDDLFNRINREPKDAAAKVENNTVTYEPPVPGVSIDKAALAAIVSELEKTENTVRVLPVTFTQPKVTVETVKAMTFRDTLATMNTQFYTGTQNDANRGENIKLAVSKISGTILAPGQTFSFNEVVGPRTQAEGYKVAHVYSDGQIIDDVGGGICQVSTTLFNAVLYSDMGIADRTNHMFTVGYVPRGQDAAVAYDYLDFKFKNTTNWPVKIEGWVTNDNKVFFSLKGTNEVPGKTIEISNKTIKTLDFTTKYIDDPTMAEGESYVKQEGMTGYVVETYKTIKQNGQTISENRIYTSTYNPLSREVVRGTKKG